MRLLLWAVPLLGFAQSSHFNLDFETYTRSQFWNWTTYGTGYQVAPDTSTFQSGSQSVRVTQISPTQSSGGATLQLVPDGMIRHHVLVSGYIQTQSLSGSAHLWLGAYQGTNTVTFANVSASGTSAWQRYSLDRDVNPGTDFVSLGVYITGSGTAWFDGISIEIDGVPVTDGPAP